MKNMGPSPWGADWDYGVPKRVSPTVERVTARNPSVFTGPGTNTWLVGRRQLVVIDPGPRLGAHVQALVQAVGGRAVAAIACTHTHADHSPAVPLLLEALGGDIPVYGALARDLSNQDTSFQPTHPLAHEHLLQAGDVPLRALHTPGHASNHFCFVEEDTGLLFSGDHIMDGSTVVISPPDGAMQAYLDSMEMLAAMPLTAVAPAHGNVIADASAEVARLIAHRLKREAKVLAAVDAVPAAGGGQTATALTPSVYDDVDPRLHGIAARSLLAHLIKLADNGRIIRLGADLWCRRAKG